MSSCWSSSSSSSSSSDDFDDESDCDADPFGDSNIVRDGGSGSSPNPFSDSNALSSSDSSSGGGAYLHDRPASPTVSDLASPYPTPPPTPPPKPASRSGSLTSGERDPATPLVCASQGPSRRARVLHRLSQVFTPGPPPGGWNPRVNMMAFEPSGSQDAEPPAPQEREEREQREPQSLAATPQAPSPTLARTRTRKVGSRTFDFCLRRTDSGASFSTSHPATGWPACETASSTAAAPLTPPPQPEPPQQQQRRDSEEDRQLREEARGRARRNAISEGSAMDADLIRKANCR